MRSMEWQNGKIMEAQSRGVWEFQSSRSRPELPRRQQSQRTPVLPIKPYRLLPGVAQGKT